MLTHRRTCSYAHMHTLKSRSNRSLHSTQCDVDTIDFSSGKCRPLRFSRKYFRLRGIRQVNTTSFQFNSRPENLRTPNLPRRLPSLCLCNAQVASLRKAALYECVASSAQTNSTKLLYFLCFYLSLISCNSNVVSLMNSHQLTHHPHRRSIELSKLTLKVSGDICN